MSLNTMLIKTKSLKMKGGEVKQGAEGRKKETRVMLITPSENFSLYCVTISEECLSVSHFSSTLNKGLRWTVKE